MIHKGQFQSLVLLLHMLVCASMPFAQIYLPKLMSVKILAVDVVTL